nr:hypothetical protein [Puniceibacterium sediminis]
MERTLRKLEHQQKATTRYRSIEQRMDETGETHVINMMGVPAMIVAMKV